MYGDALYNPYINPYAGYQQNPYQQQPKQEVVKVNGENGARAFPIGANSSAILLDESGQPLLHIIAHILRKCNRKIKKL